MSIFSELLRRLEDQHKRELKQCRDLCMQEVKQWKAEASRLQKLLHTNAAAQQNPMLLGQGKDTSASLRDQTPSEPDSTASHDAEGAVLESNHKVSCQDEPKQSMQTTDGACSCRGPGNTVPPDCTDNDKGSKDKDRNSISARSADGDSRCKDERRISITSHSTIGSANSSLKSLTLKSLGRKSSIYTATHSVTPNHV